MTFIQTNSIAITGMIATTPRLIVLPDGTSYATFRFAHNNTEDTTSWMTISAKGNRAVQIDSDFAKGMRVVVTGSLIVRDWDNGERSGTNVEIQADTVSLDERYLVIPKHQCDCNDCPNNEE